MCLTSADALDPVAEAATCGPGRLVMLAQLPADVATLAADELRVVSQRISNLAGNFGVVADAADWELAAAEHLRQLKANSALVLTALMAVIAAVGMLYSLLRITPRLKARHQVERVVKALLVLCSTVAILTTIGIVLSMLGETMKFFSYIPPTEFFFGTTWNPRFSTVGVGEQGSFGLVPLLAGTMMISAIAMLVAIPLGLMVAVYLAEYAPYKLRNIAKPAIEVLAANKVTVKIQQNDGFTPTPVVSHGVICANREANITGAPLSDGLIITPSHNPPEDGGIKYNPPHGGPADTDATDWIQKRANALLAVQLDGVKQIGYEEALASPLCVSIDYVQPYVDDLASVIDMAAIAKSGVKIGVDPLGGSGIAFWPVIAKTYGLNITVVNERVDPAFSFMPLDKDGKIRMDCSSAYSMANLIKLKDQFDIGIGNDPVWRTRDMFGFGVRPVLQQCLLVTGKINPSAAM